jgi:hypothetical protein
MRLIPCATLAFAILALTFLPEGGRPAPAPKPKDDGPITAEQLKQSADNLKAIGLAFHNYHDVFGRLPANDGPTGNKQLLSWRVQILPFLEQDNLFKQFKLDEPWDSDNNKKLIEMMPKIYMPVRGKADKGTTFYQAFGGSNGWFKAGAKLPASFPDGTSNTFLVAEAARAVVWTKPEDMEFDGKTVPALGGMFDGKFHAVMADGSVKRFKKGVDPAILKLLIDPADGNPLPQDIGEDTDGKK